MTLSFATPIESNFVSIMWHSEAVAYHYYGYIIIHLNNAHCS